MLIISGHSIYGDVHNISISGWTDVPSVSYRCLRWHPALP